MTVEHALGPGSRTTELTSSIRFSDGRRLAVVTPLPDTAGGGVREVCAWIEAERAARSTAAALLDYAFEAAQNRPSKPPTPPPAAPGTPEPETPAEPPETTSRREREVVEPDAVIGDRPPPAEPPPGVGWKKPPPGSPKALRQSGPRGGWTPPGVGRPPKDVAEQGLLERVEAGFAACEMSPDEIRDLRAEFDGRPDALYAHLRELYRLKADAPAPLPENDPPGDAHNEEILGLIADMRLSDDDVAVLLEQHGDNRPALLEELQIMARERGFPV